MEVKKIYPLSPMQKGMLFHKLMDNNDSAYFEQAIFEIEGSIDIELFKKAYNLLIDKYDILRTIFDYETFDQPMQIVRKKVEGKVYYKDLSNLNNTDKEFAIKNVRDKDREKGFNLFRDNLMRIFILKLDDLNYQLIWSHHHILMDGWCTSIIIKDLLDIYSSLKNNKEIIKAKVPTYETFINWIQKQDENETLNYWGNYIKDYEREVNFPRKSNTRNLGSKIKEKFSFNISKNEIHKLVEICNKSKVTMNVIFQCIWGIILQKYNNTNDVIFGSVLSGRNANVLGIEEMVGLFINTVPLRVKVSEDSTFNELIKQIQKEALETSKYDYYPLYEIQSKSILKNKLINNIMVFENYYSEDIKFEIGDIGFVIKEVIINEETNYDLDVIIMPAEIYTIELKYNTNLYDIDFIKNIESSFIKIIKIITDNLNIKIKDIDILSDNERSKILYEFNNNKMTYDTIKTIQELFEEQVNKKPDNIAVVFENRKLTYKELNEKSNQLARKLRDKGVEADSIVPIMVNRSVEMIIGIMAILKAGGAYLPIDSNLPKERIEYIITNSQSKILLSEKRLIEGLDIKCEFLNLYNKCLFDGEKSNLKEINNSNSLAYVIYTSGTTGNPKGVMIEHKSLNNFIHGLNKTIYEKYDEYLNVCLVAPFYFDASVQQIFATILNGHSLYITDDYTRRDPQKLLEYYEKNDIRISDGTPMHVKMLASSELIKTSNIKVEQYIIGGEELTLNTIREFYQNFTEENRPYVNNVYGPTECCVNSSIYIIDPKEVNNIELIPIGKPAVNYKLYILDKYNRLLPIGVPGELCISGDSLAKGYLNNPELTEAKFVENPFEIGTKMYRTGDLAKWLPDGNIEFLGRIDNQVKIRGFRIELSEIENRLLQNNDVKDAIVSVVEDKDEDKHICAYIVSEKVISELSLREYLKEYLPEYMIPSYFVKLDKIPIKSNGKVDKGALPKPNLEERLISYEAPRDYIEEALVEIWSEVLGLERVGINDNFFEIGGHSLKAMTLIAKIHKELNKEIPLNMLFKLPTIKQLSNLIEKSEKREYFKIDNAGEKEYYEASSAQKRMYMLQQFDGDSIAYNMPMAIELEGNIDKSKIKECFSTLVRRHEALRTYFETIEGNIVQKIDKQYLFKVNERKVNEDIDSVINKFVSPFELEKAPLFRVEIVESINKTYLLIDMHHIISDGVSMEILTKEFATLYNGQDLKPLRLQYKDFAVWQNNFLKSEEMKKQEEYWVNRFNDEIPVLNLPYDYERPAIQSFKGEGVSFEVDERTTEKLIKITKETGTTMHMVLLSAFNILLSKYSWQEDMVIGTPIVGRPHADLQNIMGMFVNTLALRNKPERDKIYIDFLKEVKENSLMAYENQSYQLEALVEKVDIRRDTSRNPLFDVMFNMVDTINDTDIELDGLLLKQYKAEDKISKFDLTLNALEKDNTLKFSIEYCSKLFNKDTIERLIHHYTRILDNITNNMQIKIGDIELLTEKEKNHILYDFNDTKADYPKEKTIQELFEEQVEKIPDNIAVVFEDKNLTYRELNEKANQLARILKNKGVKSDSIVGIIVEKSLEMIIGIIGVLKAGGAYLPIDCKCPKDRIEYMLKDSKAQMLLKFGIVENDIETDIETIFLDNESLYRGEKLNLECISSEESAAYIIYTSGSTGSPKGVLINHKNVVNICTWFGRTYELNKNKNVLQNTSISFDVSVEEIFGTILNGGTIYIMTEKNSLNRKKFRAFIKKNNINIIQLVPLTLKEFIIGSEKLENIKVLICGGEALPQSIKKEVIDIGYNLYNCYGPTEATVDAITAKCTDEDMVVIGKPVANTQIYIINQNNKLQPIGVYGELCISGDGLARGYLNKPKLNEEKFVQNPFDFRNRMYKTGDLARWLSDGNIEFIGRIDNQIKIRGYRIELGEIENTLLQNKYIKEIAVVAKENKEKEKYICAYVVSEKEISKLDLKSYLKESLPEYMIPTYFVQLEKIPLTPNGKIDRRAIQELKVDANLNAYEAPRNEVEEKLSKVWSEVLCIEKVSINDNFFELGGHSLKATLLISKIHKELNREIPLKELFKSPTIKELSKFIENAKENLYSKIEKVEEREYYEASSAQKRMYMIQQFDKDSIAYNMPMVLEVEGQFYKERIENTFKNLVIRHESLRTYFQTIKGEIVQKIDNNYDFKIIKRKNNEKIDSIINNFVRPFELENAPLFRVEVVESKERTCLLIDMHHIISDGVSMDILIKEFMVLYNGENLESLKLQYKDFAAWQNNFLKSEEMKKQEEYWVNRFNDEIPVLNLPYDYERPAMKGFEGGSLSFEVDEKTTEALRKLAKETGTTMHMVLLSALNILLSKYSGQEDIIIGTPIEGRPHADLQNIIGMFVNTLALRNKPERDKNYLDFLKEVKENSLMAYENQSYQLEALVEKVNIRRDTSRNPLFDVMFNSINSTIDGNKLKLDGVLLKQYDMKSKTSKVDFSLTLMEKSEVLELVLVYYIKLFHKETIEVMIDDYIHILKTIAMDREVTINNIILRHIEEYSDYNSDLSILEEEFCL